MGLLKYLAASLATAAVLFGTNSGANAAPYVIDLGVCGHCNQDIVVNSSFLGASTSSWEVDVNFEVQFNRPTFFRASMHPFNPGDRNDSVSLFKGTELLSSRSGGGNGAIGIGNGFFGLDPGVTYTIVFKGNGEEFAGWYIVNAPVPEPESYAMLLAGLGMLGAAVRRRKARSA